GGAERSDQSDRLRAGADRDGAAAVSSAGAAGAEPAEGARAERLPERLHAAARSQGATRDAADRAGPVNGLAAGVPARRSARRCLGTAALSALCLWSAARHEA